MAQGATFVAAGHDVGLLRAGALALRAALAGK
jgi:2-keto-3-deoxy-L-rhamnonate aldolase RhmA